MKVLKGFAVEEILNTLLDNECRLMNDYSGRGMFGESCFGFVYDETGQLATVALKLYWDEAKELWGELMKHASYDSMGLGTVIYFRGYRVHAGVFKDYEED